MEYIKLCDICDFQGGSQPPKDEWSSDLKDGYIRMLQIRDFTQSEKVTPEYIKITKTTKICESDDILIARYGASLGKILTGLAGAYNVAIMRTVPDINVLEKRYLYYYLKSPVFQRFLLNVGSRAAQSGFNKNDLQDLLIPNISKRRQLEIIGILEQVESVIETRKKELQKLDDLIRSRFIELFGDPVYNTNDLPIRSLNELGSWASGGTPSRTVPEYFEGNIDWYSAGELNTLFLEGSVEKITEEAIEKSTTKLFKAGSLLIGMYDTAAFKMGILKENSASNQACACITPNDEVDIIWLYYELQMMKNYFLSQRRGVRQKNLNLGMIKAFKIPIAKRDQQDEFSDFVKQVNKSKVAIQAALDKTQLLFDSLMQKYFG